MGQGTLPRIIALELDLQQQYRKLVLISRILDFLGDGLTLAISLYSNGSSLLFCQNFGRSCLVVSSFLRIFILLLNAIDLV